MQARRVAKTEEAEAEVAMEGLNAMQAWAAKSRAQRSRKGTKEILRTSSTVKKTRPAPRKRAATKASTARAQCLEHSKPKLAISTVPLCLVQPIA